MPENVDLRLNVGLVNSELKGASTYLILCSIPNEPLCVSEADITGSGPVSHVICNDLYSVILPDSHTAILHVEAQIRLFYLARKHLPEQSSYGLFSRCKPRLKGCW